MHVGDGDGSLDGKESTSGPGITKMDEFSENCQTALDPPLALFLEKILQIAILQNLIRFGDARQMEYYH